MKIDFIKADKKTLDAAMDLLEKKNNSIDDTLLKERSEWGEQLNPLYEKLRNREKGAMIDLQADTLSLRHRIQDKITYYMAFLSKKSPMYKKSVGDRLEFYATGFGIKANGTEKKIFVDRDLGERKRNVELLENHIEFLRECRYSCDQIQYAVKNVVGLAQYVV